MGGELFISYGRGRRLIVSRRYMSSMDKYNAFWILHTPARSVPRRDWRVTFRSIPLKWPYFEHESQTCKIPLTSYFGGL